ncbi:MAG: response regulator transcription factor [Alistipes sp.]|nr:response regulator transcription factor [Alistipes sp.]
MSISCIVIDDEPLAVRQMESYIARIPFLDRIASFSSAVEARQWLDDGNSTELIFVDINMPELNGVEFVRSMAQSRPLIIFTTAYSEYAVEGFKLDAVDYLLKPFSFSAFERSAHKAQSVIELLRLRDSDDRPALPVSEQSSTERECISIRADHKTTLVRYSNIIYLESAGEYVRLHLADGTKLVTLFRLKNMESALPSDRFVRVHRSFIVNTDHITGYTKGRVFLTGDDYVPIGEIYKESFSSVVEKIG